MAGFTAFTAIPTLPPTFDTSCGIGFVTYVPVKLARVRPGEVRPLLCVAAVLFALISVVLAA